MRSRADAGPATGAWHSVSVWGGDLYTSNPPPPDWAGSDPRSLGDAMALSPRQTRQMVATHEAGHTVVGLVVGLRIIEATVRRQGDREGHFSGHASSPVPWLDWAAALAGGERAVDAWLRRAGLWTPTRAWWAEVTACSDRTTVEDKAREVALFSVGYGTSTSSMWDYGEACHRADEVLAAHWSRVEALAAELDRAGVLDATTIARVTGLPNP